jgi:hypothetical protein
LLRIPKICEEARHRDDSGAGLRAETPAQFIKVGPTFVNLIWGGGICDTAPRRFLLQAGSKQYYRDYKASLSFPYLITRTPKRHICTFEHLLPLETSKGIIVFTKLYSCRISCQDIYKLFPAILLNRLHLYLISLSNQIVATGKSWGRFRRHYLGRFNRKLQVTVFTITATNVLQVLLKSF